ncbi:MAG: hypothetical protein FWH17_09260 [Oscillospiraceae bacterium]|nr:hypothetical protein [Oscillospiraceae bacterium]
MDPKRIFKDVNISSMNFINNRNDFEIKFIDSLSTGEFCGSLACFDIKTFTMSTMEDDDLSFPQFICDVYSFEEDNLMKVSLMGGNYEIEIVCIKAKITQ